MRTTQQAHERDALVARQDARALALALRALLRTPAVLELLPSERRVDVVAGDVVVDAEVGWLAAVPRAAPDAVLAERLRVAQLAEFVGRDAAAASAHFDEVLGARAPDDGRLLPVLTAAAWQAHRAGDAVRAAALHERLDAHLARHTPAAAALPDVADAAAASVLLAAARGLARAASAPATPRAADAPFPPETPTEPFPPRPALPPFSPVPPFVSFAPLSPCSPPPTLPTANAHTAALLAAAPADVAGPTLARLAERGVDATALRDQHTRVLARREVLDAAARVLRSGAEPAVLRRAGDALALWFAGARAGDGRFALADRAWLAALPGLGTSRPLPAGLDGLPPLPERGALGFGAAPADAEEVAAEWLWVAPLPVPPAPWFAHPLTVVGAAALLALVFAASALALLRAFASEAAALRARSEFVTGVTHELKTPVASIRLVADLLRDDDVGPARQREYVGLLAGEAARLAALVDNVLDVGQIERGERAYDLRPGDLAELVRDVVAAFAPLARSSGVELVLHEGAGDAPALVDAQALAQALLNVCDNARKYAAAGRRLDVHTARAGATFTIDVRDFGPGVPAAEREAIFDRFVRGAAHRHGAIPGVGLGLHLARAIVQRHGGALVCAAPADASGGARFVFTLPLLATDA